MPESFLVLQTVSNVYPPAVRVAFSAFSSYLRKVILIATNAHILIPEAMSEAFGPVL
jgi:hypothetical protein